MATDVARGLTDQQRRAVTARGVSVALSAGAGCGKTFVLTERFLAQLDPDGPQAGPAEMVSHEGEALSDGDAHPRLAGLVAITFTERAAREMRDRIRAACRRRVLEAPDAEVDYWLDLIRELDSARISTIHSFCGTLLRAHAVEAGLDPRFRVLEQAQADTLLYELVDDELRNRLIARDEAVIDLVFEFGLESLRGMVAALLGMRHQIDWPQWRDVTPDELVGRWETFSRELAGPRLSEAIARSDAAQSLLRIAREQCPDHPTMRDRCAVLLERLPRLPESTDPAGDLGAIFESAKVQGAGGKKAWPSEEVYAEFRDAAKKLREQIKGAQNDVAFDATAALPAAEAGLRLLSVAEGVHEAYEARKHDLAAMDFNDLLIHAKRLLTAPESRELRGRLAAQIRLLLVDEFQDTDPVQVELVKALCDPLLTRGKLFFVGDYKQSIYRFRGADPHVFRALRGEIPPEGRLPLTLNFRSQPAILHFVNALFSDAMDSDYEPLAANRPQVGPEPAIELLWAPEESPQERSGRSARLRRREADWIARRLRAMLDRGDPIVWDEEAAERGEPGTRAVRPGDVALLFRALSDVQHYEEALQRYAIPYYLVGGHAFYAQQEIYDLLNLLRSLAGRCDEVSLVGVLRSPIFALEDETLFWLAQQPGGLSGGLFAETPPDELGDAQRRRVEFARDTLADLRAMKDRVPIAELVDEALARTGYDAVLLAEFLGERKLANLRKLVDQARSFDRSGIFSLSDFITRLAEFVARQPDEPLAATHPEASDVVRLMTIHQSKGLEFPVVVVPDLDRAARASSASVAFTPPLGPMVKSSGPSGFRLHAAMEREEDRAEMIRLLYVATTRAADYLILSGGVPEIGSARGPWTQLLARRFDPSTGRLRAALPAGYPEPKVRVTLSEPPLSGKPSRGRAQRSLSKLAERAVQMAEQGSGRVPELLGPVAVDRGARRQYSFSRLTGELHAHRAVSEPADLGETEEALAIGPRLDPLGLGTLVHDVLAEIDLGRPDDAAPLVRRLAPRHLPDVEEGEGLAEPIEMVLRFLKSPRAAELAASRRVHRELEFLLAWPPGTREPEPRYLQGYIDCLYQDAASRWVVLDYKTNRVTASTIGAVAAGYEMQMLLYALAIERILGEPPGDLVLHFLRLAAEHHFAWDDAARGRVMDLVNRSLAACVEP
ncbi:MAG TPA: UvrD-helicase domain-containing protein [Thermoguttaceae bacterium]|nr:UvrD-helicase domain-containing protein [Thermoguttaceae bacterium]